MAPITFTNEDFMGIDTNQDDPMVITIEVANCTILKTLVNQESSLDVFYLKTFKKMGIPFNEVVPHDEQIIRFSRERSDTKDHVNLYTMFGEDERQKTVKIRYLIVDADKSYNAMLGRSSLN